MTCLICIMSSPGVSHEERGETYIAAHLGALYMVMSKPVSIEEHFRRFLSSLCPAHRPIAHAVMTAFVEDEEDLKIRRRLLAVTGATPS